MKKAISILLTLCMVFSCFSIGFADVDTTDTETEKVCECENIPIVYVPGFGAGLYLNPESDDRKAVYPPSATDIISAIPALLFAIIGVATGNEALFGKAAVNAANKLLSKLSCDDDGKPIYNTSIDPFEYPEYDIHQNVTNDIIDRSFDFEYDWRLSPLDNADKLKAFIDYVKELTGHSEIALVCHSQGNTVVAAYLEEYGNGGIAKIAFLSPAYQGISILGSLYRKEANISDKADELLGFITSVMGESDGTDAVSVLLKILNTTGFTGGLLNFLQKYLSSQFDLIFSECLAPAFGNLAGTWAFVPDEYFSDAVETMFSGRKDAPILKKIRYYHDNVQTKLPEIIQKTMDDGTDVIICAGYNISTIPVSLTPAVHSDFLIDTEYMSIGATVAPFGKTLGNNYKQTVDCGHDHVSDDMLVDASTGAFPEITWYFSGLSHAEFPEDYYIFLNRFLFSEEKMTVRTYEEYPQFMKKDKDGRLVPVEAEEESGKGIFGFLSSIFSF